MIFFKIVLIVLFMIDHALLYFILISKINNGILHFYFFILYVCGILFYMYIFDKQRLNKID